MPLRDRALAAVKVPRPHWTLPATAAAHALAVLGESVPAERWSQSGTWSVDALVDGIWLRCSRMPAEPVRLWVLLHGTALSVSSLEALGEALDADARDAR